MTHGERRGRSAVVDGKPSRASLNGAPHDQCCALPGRLTDSALSSGQISTIVRACRADRDRIPSAFLGEYLTKTSLKPVKAFMSTEARNSFFIIDSS